VEGEPQGTVFTAESVRWLAGGVGMISATKDGGVPRESKI